MAFHVRIAIYLFCMAALALCTGCHSSPRAEMPAKARTVSPTLTAVGPDRAGKKWVTFTDAQRHFHLQYPPTWKVNTEVVSVAHYSMVFAALNSAGMEGFTVQNVQTSPTTWEFGPDLVAQQVPVGTVYIDICWQDGPGGLQQFGPGIQEMEAADLSGPLKENKETRSGELITRTIWFSKWGKQWNVKAYMHSPVSTALREDVNEVLASFRFDGLPAGDKV